MSLTETAPGFSQRHKCGASAPDIISSLGRVLVGRVSRRVVPRLRATEDLCLVGPFLVLALKAALNAAEDRNPVIRREGAEALEAIGQTARESLSADQRMMLAEMLGL